MKHAELIARLEAVEVGSRELGRDILVALNQVHEVDEFTYYGIGTEQVWHFGEHAEDDGKYHILPDPSSSVDSAIALAERVLPGFVWRVESHSSGMFDAALWADPDDNHVGYGRSVYPALALCIAILRALDAKTTTP